MGKSINCKTLTAGAMVKHLPGVDLVKFIMAFCVVAIHFRPNYGNGWEYPMLFDWFIKLGVPFFFITSGFLLQRKFEGQSAANCNRIALMRALKIFRLWGSWLLISLPLAIYSYQHMAPIDAIKSYIYNLLLYGWTPRAAPLWFLYSMIWVCLIVSLSVRIKHYKALLLALFLIIVGLNWFADISQYPLLLHLKVLTKHTLGGGAYMVIGMMLNEYHRTKIGGGQVAINHHVKHIPKVLRVTLLANYRRRSSVFDSAEPTLEIFRLPIESQRPKYVDLLYT